MIEFNLNNYIYVRLTDKGRKELKRQHDELNAELKGFLKEYIPPVEDENGWSRWQAHNIFHRLGHLLYAGSDVPFETTMRIDEKDLK